MSPFTFRSTSRLEDALQAGSVAGNSYLAGGTTLIDLWKLGAYPVDQLIDITPLPLLELTATPDQLRLGALTSMSLVGSHPDVMKNYPVLSQSLLLSASPQLRNMATMGGNLLQRPRSISYRNPDPKLRDGPSRFDAIFGVTPRSAACHPSDMAVALLALDASVRLRNQQGERVVKLADFYKLPDNDLSLTMLAPGELITQIELDHYPAARRSAYVKVRDRASWQFAIVSAAVVLESDGDIIRNVRIAAGGVGTKPWRFPQVEQQLQGKDLNNLEAELQGLGDGALTHADTSYKVKLLKRTVLQALKQARQIV